MNKEVFIRGFIFAAGAAIGSAVIWKLLKTKYEQIATEEIESVKEAFSNRKDISEDSVVELSDEEKFHVDESVEDAAKKEKAINEAKKIALGYNYVSLEEKEEKEENDMVGPYVISPEEFGEEGYVIISLTYYTDGIVTNENGKIIGNADELLGKDFADHFGDYEYDPDAVYVRNDDIEVDYEILKDYRAYTEIE